MSINELGHLVDDDDVLAEQRSSKDLTYCVSTQVMQETIIWKFEMTS